MKTWRKFALVALFGTILVSPAPAAPELDRLTPREAEVVVQVNVRQALQTPIVKKHVLDPIKLLLKRNGELKELLTAAGVDPLKDIDTICLSSSGNPMAGGKMLAVVRGNFDVDKARKAAEEYARKHPGRLKSGKDPAAPWEIIGDHKTFYAAFADSKTLVMTGSREDTVAVVARAGQSPQRPSKALQDALNHLKGGENMWLTMVATDEIKQLLKNDDTAKDIAAALQSVTGAVELTDDAKLALAIHTTGPEAATQIKGKLDELMPLLSFVGSGKDKSGRIVKELLDSIKLKTEKNDVTIRLQITEDQIDKVHKQEH